MPEISHSSTILFDTFEVDIEDARPFAGRRLRLDFDGGGDYCLRLRPDEARDLIDKLQTGLVELGDADDGPSDT